MPIGLASLFREKALSPPELVAKAVNALEELDRARKAKHAEKALEDAALYLAQMRIWLFGDDASFCPAKDAAQQLAKEACKTRLLSLLVLALKQLDFETRRDATLVFTTILRASDTAAPGTGVGYVIEHPELLEVLIEGYDDPEIALNCGMMLRECIKFEPLARAVLYGPRFMTFFDKVEMANFEIASDAYTTFKALLTLHKDTAAEFLRKNGKPFAVALNKLLQSGNYVTRRQSLKLVSEMAFDARYLDFSLDVYVADPANLMTIMNMMKDASRNIQLDAFHVFKAFLGNPRRPEAITAILRSNKEKLCKYLQAFHSERDEDEVFRDEKAAVIQQIAAIGPAESRPLSARPSLETLPPRAAPLETAFSARVSGELPAPEPASQPEQQPAASGEGIHAAAPHLAAAHSTGSGGSGSGGASPSQDHAKPAGLPPEWC